MWNRKSETVWKSVEETPGLLCIRGATCTSQDGYRENNSVLFKDKQATMSPVARSIASLPAPTQHGCEKREVTVGEEGTGKTMKICLLGLSNR